MAYPYQSYQNPYQQGYYPMYQQPQYQQPIQQPVQQPIQQTAPQTYSPVINQNGIIWISGEQEAAMYPIAPNNAVALWAKDGKTIYLKSADATGKPTMRIYDLVERAESVSEATEKADRKSDEYATKRDLAAVVGVVKGFDDLISGMKADIEKMNGDLYGIAGKKRTVKKPVEVEEDDE